MKSREPSEGVAVMDLSFVADEGVVEEKEKAEEESIGAEGTAWIMS